MLKRLADWRTRMVEKHSKAAELLRRISVWCMRLGSLIKRLPGDFWRLLVWIVHSPIGLKRFADVLEKMGAAILAVGLFQGKISAFPYGLICLYACFRITQDQEKKK